MAARSGIVRPRWRGTRLNTKPRCATLPGASAADHCREPHRRSEPAHAVDDDRAKTRASKCRCVCSDACRILTRGATRGVGQDGELHAEHDGREYYVNADTQESSWEVPPQFAWKRLNGETVYYFNTITGESHREKPEEMGHVDDETGRTYWIDKRTGEPTWESDHWWTEVTIESDDDSDMVGRTYWQQETTKEVQWDKPEVLGWVEWFDEVKDEL